MAIFIWTVLLASLAQANPSERNDADFCEEHLIRKMDLLEFSEIHTGTNASTDTVRSLEDKNMNSNESSFRKKATEIVSSMEKNSISEINYTGKLKTQIYNEPCFEGLQETSFLKFSINSKARPFLEESLEPKSFISHPEKSIDLHYMFIYFGMEFTNTQNFSCSEYYQERHEDPTIAGFECSCFYEKFNKISTDTNRKHMNYFKCSTDFMHLDPSAQNR